MYFNEKGKTNTRETINLALQRAKQERIRNIVIASCTGYTCDFIDDIKDLNIVCVTHSYGFIGRGKIEMSDEKRADLIRKGFKVLTTTHVLSGAERGISSRYSGLYPIEIMANSLRMLGEGLKVSVEVSIMALDSGLIPFGEKIIAIGGSARGADTAVIITPSHAASILDTKIHEIICKPKNF
ncbi:pyruvate kinase alpha/beta domain-containing protein [Gottschalkia acidurici]|uniref:pyruvate kinase alpha/beta domain-containing protein n=1 Tax=Clostridium acidurici TaxID=1556 RepID=UPI00031CCBE9|nr:pyruvate kinase alpha/beta domain-containing protein [Gottschalkia acidurici]